MSSTERPSLPTKAATPIHSLDIRNLSPHKTLGKENYYLSVAENAATKHNDSGAITRLDSSARRMSSHESPRRQHMAPFSPRKQLARNEDVSFTPCRTQLPPRAWERVPAKPFAARSEGQKIWKRVPLQDIGIDPNVQNQESRREKNAKQDYLRTVKRMRVDADTGARDDQPAFIDTSAAMFWPTRIEEEVIEERGNPRKKAPQQSTWMHVKVDEKEMQEAIEGSTDDEQPSGNQENLAEHRQDTPTAAVSCDVDDLARQSQEVTAFSSEQSPTSEIRLSCTAQVAAISSPLPTNEENVFHESPAHEGPTSGSQTADNKNQLLTHARIVTQDEELSPEITEQSESKEFGMATNWVPEPPSYLSSPTKGCDGFTSLPTTDVESNSEVGVTEECDEATGHTEAVLAATCAIASAFDAAPNPTSRANLASAADIDLFDLSAPTRNMESEQTVSPETDEVTTVDEILASMPSPDVNKAALSRSTSTMTGLEQEEDTAFLADFLLRAKASKAAREASSMPSSMIEAPSVFAQSASDTQNSPTNVFEVGESLHETEQPASIMPELSEESEQTIESSASSPLRRSTRAASTRLPRPQALPPVPQFGPVLPSQNVALPNTIQLKRATGNEFVFNAKPQQNVHIMTRTNTKRNQGNAVHADVRLQQLKSEGAEHSADSNVQQSNSPSKKRKRARDEESKSARKLKKNVKWQEELVSYREPTPLDTEPNLPASDDFAAIEAAAQAEALRSMTESFSMPVTSRLEVTEIEQDPHPDKQGDDEAKAKVRKVRRTNVGNVNGTPAPKTRTRSQLLVHAKADTDAEVSTEALAASSKSRSGGSKQSKMPLPVSNISAGTTAPSQPIDRKLDGKRRLRART